MFGKKYRKRWDNVPRENNGFHYRALFMQNTKPGEITPESPVLAICNTSKKNLEPDEVELFNKMWEFWRTKKYKDWCTLEEPFFEFVKKEPPKLLTFSNADNGDVLAIRQTGELVARISFEECGTRYFTVVVSGDRGIQPAELQEIEKYMKE